MSISDAILIIANITIIIADIAVIAVILKRRIGK